jgi:uncharacterized SAM-binding protein YcdF (DUF218 family)
MVSVLLLLIAVLCVLLFARGVRRDPRRFRNAIYLGLGIAAAALHVVDTVGRARGVGWGVTALLAFAVPVLAWLVLTLLLLVNGLKMLRQESRALSHLLSLAASFAMILFTALTAVTLLKPHPVLSALWITALLIGGYLSFVFACFIGYSFIYQNLGPLPAAEFVLVLGCGLAGGTRVTPLLAGRLDRALRVREELRARGLDPVMLVSGGQGRDEVVAEAQAMAEYLAQQGVPQDRVLREAESRNTVENLKFGRALMDERVPAGYACVIVTSNFHTMRTALLARALEVNASVVGSPTAAYYWPSATIREYTALLWTHKWINLAACALLVIPGALLLAA